MEKNTLTMLAKDVYRLTVLFPTREPLRYKIREVADDLAAGFIMEENDYLGSMRRLLEVMDSYFEIAASQDWTSPAKINEIKNNYARIGQELSEAKLSREEADRAAKEEKAEEEESAASGSRDVIGTGFVVVVQEPKTEIIPPIPTSVMEPCRTVAPMVMPEPVNPSFGSEAKNSGAGNIAKEDILPTASVSEAAREVKSGSEDEEEGDEDDEEDRGGLTSGQIARQNRIAEFLKENGSAQVWEILKIFPNISKRTIRRDFRSMLKQGLIERTGERNTTAYKLKINIS